MSSSPVNAPRICMPTWDRFSNQAFQAGLKEAQDVLVECDDVELIRPEPAAGFRLRESLQWTLIFKDASRRLAFVNPGLKPVRLSRQYDLFVMTCSWHTEPLYVNAIRRWKDHCKTSVCWISEFWANRVRQHRSWLHLLNEFDHVVIGVRAPIKALEDVLGRRCHYVPYGVDAIRFSPYPQCPERVIDIYSIGRRFEAMHQALRKVAAEARMFYMYDTLQSANSSAPDHRQHREMLASVAKRSRFFVVAPGKSNVPDETQGEVGLSSRYFEGAAAGAVMIGQSANCEPFRELFGWPDSVVEMNQNGSDVAEVIRTLHADPERLAEISRRNSFEALMRLDWAYRWKEILSIAGLEPQPAMQAREERLRDLAALTGLGSSKVPLLASTR